ncbi:EexN family lipoprotein [Nitrosospira sp. NpAV]|uniref:EexN family lipoprotein n=1 Tax=Nitrosospira sp. NpAV TaxID=58133 RepID=UPI0012EC9DF8|nr:EexN family lipoprotein [Nitrosospira sp. NpAV]
MKRQVVMVSLAASTFLGSMLAGCETRKIEEEVRSIDWYQTNDAERAAKLIQCRSDPGKYDATPNCINASRAENNAKADTRWGTKSEDVRTEPKVP